MNHYRSGELTLAYHDAGSGPPVILVHGFASHHDMNWGMTGWLERLVVEGYRVIAPDLRGHGQSDKPHQAGAYGPQAFAADLIALMDHLGIGQAPLIGYSMGARAVLALLDAAPHRVSRAVLAGAGANLLSPRDTAEIAAALEGSRPVAELGPTARAFRQFAERTGSDLTALALCIQEVRRPPDPAILARVTTPVLVIAGAKDEIAHCAGELAAEIPGARFVEVPDGDHMTVIALAPFKSAILDFLAEAG